MENEFQILQQIKKVDVPNDLFKKIKLKINENELSKRYLPVSWAAAAILVIFSVNAFALRSINKPSVASSIIYSSSLKLTIYD